MSLSKKPITLVVLFYCFCVVVDSAAPEKKSTHQTVQEIQNLAGSVSPSENSLKASDEFRASAQYYYPGQKYHYQGVPQWSRDSYSEAAADFGYNVNGGQHNLLGSHGHAPSYAVPPPSYGLTGGDDGFDFDGAGPVGAGIAALIGLKGLKGLGILGLLKAGFLGLIPLFFLLLPALIVIPLLLLLLPIPVITVPAAGNGRTAFSSGIDLSSWSSKVANLARSVADSDKCIERISCEMSRISRGSLVDRTIKRVLYRFEPHLPLALQRMAKAYMESTGCRNYGCYVMDDFQAKRPK